MSKTSTLGSSRKKMMPTRLVMGLMVAAVSVLVGTAGVASAMPQNDGRGYGGDINIGIGDIIGDNNVIVIIVNYFTGK